MKTTKCKKKTLSGYGLRLSLLNGASDTFFYIPLSFKYVFQDCFNSNIQSFCFLFSFQCKRRNLDYVKKTQGEVLCRRKYSYINADRSYWKYKHIAEKLVEAGFNLGAVPAEKCKNKWNNLKKNVKTFLDNAKKTGAAPMDKPQFYEEVMAVIYDDPSITLSNIVDTSKDETIEREGPTIVLETVSEDDKENHRKKATSPITPPPAKRYQRQTMAETLKRLDELKKSEEENKNRIASSVRPCWTN